MSDEQQPGIIAIHVDEDGCIRQVDNNTGLKVTSVKYGDSTYTPAEPRDVLQRAQTALENIADWEKRHGKGINLVPIITDLANEVRKLRQGEQ